MNPDLLVGIFSVALSGLYGYSAWSLPDAFIGNPMAPKYFPLVLAATGFLCGIGLVIKALKQGKVKTLKFPAIVLNLVVITCAIIYSLIFERIGFIPSTILFLGGMLFFVNGVKEWKINLVISLCFTFGAWYVFERLFFINLP